jgi:ribonuclease HI
MDKNKLTAAIEKLTVALSSSPGPPGAAFSTTAYGRDNPMTASQPQPQAPNHNAAFAAVLEALRAISED